MKGEQSVENAAGKKRESAAPSYPPNPPYLYKRRKDPSTDGVFTQCTARGGTCGKGQKEVSYPIVLLPLTPVTRSPLPPFQHHFPSPPPPSLRPLQCPTMEGGDSCRLQIKTTAAAIELRDTITNNSRLLTRLRCRWQSLLWREV